MGGRHVNLRVEQPEPSDPARAFVDMPGQEPVEISTLVPSFAANKLIFEKWTAFLKDALARFLIDNGEQIKRITDLPPDTTT